MEVLKVATKTLQLAIQTAVNGVKTVVDAIKLVVDATKTKVDTTATKVDTIDNKVGTLLDGRVVKSVQRGITTGTGAAANKTVPISAVNIDKCYIDIVGAANNNVNAEIVLISLTSTTLTIGSSVNGNTWQTDARASWQVIEFY